MSSSIFKDDIFKGKVIFASGGASKMISAMVKAMMRLGCDAIILGRKQESLDKAQKELQNETGRKCLTISCDVRDAQKMSDLLDKAVGELGRLDFCIAGAAGNFLAPIQGLSANAFATVIQIDLLGTFNVFKAALPHIKKTKGAFLAVSATLHYTGTQLQAHASAAKAGVDALSRVMAVECGPLGIRSNILAPGPIADTEGMSRLSPKAAGDLVNSTIPLQRLGTIEEIANTTVFLFSDAASYISGTEIVVDGGTWHISNTFVPYPDVSLTSGSFERSRL